jgi:hypothetical protein
MLERVPSRLLPTDDEPLCAKCELGMKGVNLIPGFAVYSKHIFQCAKCGHIQVKFESGRKAAWKDTFTGKT